MERRPPLPKVLAARRIVQWVAVAAVIVIGLQFTLWVVPHLDGRWPEVSRPPGVEAFLPIGGMLATRHLLQAGVVDAVHPAGLAIFVAICVMSVVMAKSFCSHVCPIGLLSELLGRLGIRLTGRALRLPRWLDLPLRGLKFLLLSFFVWAIWFAMDPQAVAAFLTSPYNTIVDAKMWLFFAHPSRLTVTVVGVLVVGSVFVRDLWCRYLCPYGALLGVLGRLAPLKVTRDDSLCTGCQGCTRACPAASAGPPDGPGRVDRVLELSGLRGRLPGSRVPGNAVAEPGPDAPLAPPGDRCHGGAGGLPGGGRRVSDRRPLAHRA